MASFSLFRCMLSWHVAETKLDQGIFNLQLQVNNNYGSQASPGRYYFRYLIRFLSSVGHTTSLHTFKLFAHAALLDLALFTHLGILKVAPVTELHKMSTLVNFTLETTQSRFNGFTISNFHLDIDGQVRRGSGG